MNKAVKIILAVVAVIIVAVVAVLLFSKPAVTPVSNNVPQDTTGGSDSSAIPEVTITYDGNGFTLTGTTVKSGDTVKVANKSTKELEFDSDPHPAHTDNSELNAGRIPAGRSATFTLTTKGKWGFHNHLNASQKGELTVE